MTLSHDFELLEHILDHKLLGKGQWDGTRERLVLIREYEGDG